MAAVLLSEELLLLALDDDTGANRAQWSLDAALADALAAIAAEGRARSAKHWASALPRRVKPIQARVAEALVDRGTLSEQQRRTLGIFRTTRYVEADPAAEDELHERLSGALLGTGEVDARTALLVALLQPTELVARVVPRERRKEAKARAKEIADRGVVGDAVDDAIRGVQAAIIACVATTAAATAATSGSGG